MQAAEKSIAKQLQAMIRLVIIDNGIIASSPIRDSQMKKRVIAPAAPQKSPITMALLQL
jgi:hypothetical protein